MKIIFLDIDGVLIRFGNTEQIRKTRAEKGKGGLITSLDEDLVDNLVEVLKQTNAYIVISSSWRHGLMEILRDEFYKNGDRLSFDLWNRVISKTPSGLNHGRGNEILTWINEHHKTCRDGEHITSWVAIDDDNFDMKCVSRLGRFVHTKTSEGLTKNKTKEVIFILK